VSSRERFDVVVIGAGAAGLFCAIEAGKRGRRVLVIEHAERLGKKILISGGGRCNFTNIHTKADSFLSENPHFAKSALARYTPADFLALVKKHAIPYHEKTLGQLFCDRAARDILTLLESECREASVEIALKTPVRRVGKEEAGFEVESDGRAFEAASVVIATGGLSIPKMGASALGYEIARQFGLRVVECRPALVPFILSEDDRAAWGDLTGVSTEVVASIGKREFRENMLITHRGLSGPAILQISSYWLPEQAVLLDVAPDLDVTGELRRKPAGRDLAALKNALYAALPQRFSTRWLQSNTPLRWTNAALAEFEQGLHRWAVTPSGTEGYEKAEVTAGGVDTAELSARTMESRKVPGLFFVGEVVDVTGHLGGFNFQWAWASGYCAGQAA
jgi:predicted Rossmann fold flavoprotein